MQLTAWFLASQNKKMRVSFSSPFKKKGRWEVLEVGQEVASEKEVAKAKEEFFFEVARLVGTPKDGFWSQVHSYFPQEEEKKSKRGDLLAVLTIAGVEEGIEAVSLGREVLGRLHEEYYGDLEGSAFERLAEAVKKVGKEQEGVEIVAASVLGRKVCLAIWGEGMVVLKRGTKLGVVLKGEEDFEPQTASGFLEEGDLFLLGSRNFFQAVGEEDLKVALEGQSAVEAMESLSPLILGKEGMAGAAALLALVKRKISWSIPTIVQEEERKDYQQSERPVEKEKLAVGKRLHFWPKRTFFVQRERGKSKKLLWGVAFFLLLALGVCLFLGLERKKTEERAKRAEELGHLAEEKINLAKDTYLKDVVEGKKLLDEAEKLIEEGLSLKEKESELMALKGKIEELRQETGKEVELKEVGVFMDLGLIEDGAFGERFSLVGKNLAILDKKRGKVYFLDIRKKSFLVVDGPKEGEFVAGLEEKAAVWGKEGIWEIDFKNRVSSLKIAKDDSWRKIVALGSFGNNLYLLDAGVGDLWRYLASERGYGGKKSWFLVKPPDLTGGKDMAIDGAVWLLVNKEILKFNLGKQVDFSLKRMPEELGEPVKIYTSLESKGVYILDKVRKKIYEIDKEGNFRASWFWQGLEGATDLVVLEDEGKIFVLAGTKIYEIKKD